MTDWEKLVDWLIAAELGGKGKCTQPGDNDRDDDDYDDDDGDDGDLSTWASARTWTSSKDS